MGWLALLAVGTTASADESDTTSAPVSAAAARGLEQHVAALDRELAALQTHTRRYVAGWLVANSVFAAAQIGIALSSDSAVVRSNYWVGAGLSTAGGVMLLAQPWPGLRAHTRYREMPGGDTRANVAKIDYGESLRARQRRQDRGAITPIKHAIALAIGLGAGVRAGYSFGSVYQGLFRTLFVVSVLELQILTRPRNVLAARSELDKNPRWLWSAGPWIEARSFGAQISARF